VDDERKLIKVFWFFFSKKNLIFFFAAPTRPGAGFR